MMSELQANLTQVISAGRLPNGYIIVGPVEGEGRALAEWLGSQLLGTSTVMDHTHPDMPWYQPEKVSRIIDVEMMVERILPFAQQSSLTGGWKVPVIVSADRMNESSANAFLKMLEEPPPQTLFLLLVDRLDEMLPTIISRCQVLQAGGKPRLAEPWRSSVIDLLADIREKSPLLDAMRAERLCEIIDEMDERAEAEIRAEHKENTLIDEAADVLKARIGARSKAWRKDLWMTLEQWMQDLVRVRSTDGAFEALHFPECRAVLEQRAKCYSLARLFENLSILEAMQAQLDRHLLPAQILPYWMDRFYL